MIIVVFKTSFFEPDQKSTVEKWNMKQMSSSISSWFVSFIYSDPETPWKIKNTLGSSFGAVVSIYYKQKHESSIQIPRHKNPARSVIDSDGILNWQLWDLIAIVWAFPSSQLPRMIPDFVSGWKSFKSTNF